jgi:transcriptional regulator with XRE-family HTH domain
MTGLDLKLLRIRRGVRQYKLASSLGINPSRLSLLENERLPLTPEMAERATRALEVRHDSATTRRGGKGEEPSK